VENATILQHFCSTARRLSTPKYQAPSKTEKLQEWHRPSRKTKKNTKPTKTGIFKTIRHYALIIKKHIHKNIYIQQGKFRFYVEKCSIHESRAEIIV